MSIRLQYTLSKKSIYVIALFVSLIVIIALIILSYLINNESQKTNEDFVRKGFFRKYEAIEHEFKNIEEYQSVLQNVINRSDKNNYADHFSILNDLNLNRKLIRDNWYTFYQSDKEKITDKNILSKVLHKPTIKDFKNIYLVKNQQINNFLINYNDTLYWVNYDTIKVSETENLFYGSTINLYDLYRFFIDIDINATNYAYIFNKDGICLTHPNEKFIGKNVFDFTDIKANDTITSTIVTRFPQDKYTENEASSEFIENTNIKRFIKPLKTKNFDGYVVVNHLDLIINENVARIKFYITFIFLATFLLIIFIFLLFNKLTTKAYKEKEEINDEKNRLIVENEKINNVNTLNQLQQLKNQINPHFLFNSLNSLYMLIGLNKENAQKFTMNLSKIYRYLIVPPKENTVIVEKELAFIQQYMELQESRFSEELIFKLIIEDEKSLAKKIPYLALQIVVENSIKHNIATIDEPLTIQIFVKTKAIVVRNTLQLKNNRTDNENFGLNYMQQMYQYHQNNEFKAYIKNDEFICVLPLL